jgi:FAD dependent oxidoreductase TIGR03364
MEKSMKHVAIVGAGIVGLAHAYAYAKRGWRVTVYERSWKAQGASVRNFGMLWPIGQPQGELAELAMRSRAIWLELLEAAGLPYFATGSLHLTYHEDEARVAEEFAAMQPERGSWISPAQTLARSGAVVEKGLRGALWSEHEVVVDPRLTLAGIPEFLDEQFGVVFRFGTVVAEAASLDADLIVVCSGHDFETMYPAVYAASDLLPCKLQMLRTVPQPNGWALGPALAGGLTLRFYASFRDCPSLPALRARYATELAEYDRWGIHVMASQMADGTLTLGDSHEYGLAIDVFNKEEIDGLILKYLGTFAKFPTTQIGQRWYGIYAKNPNGAWFTVKPEDRVRIVTGLGGAGMTLSMGLAEKLVAADVD